MIVSPQTYLFDHNHKRTMHNLWLILVSWIALDYVSKRIDLIHNTTYLIYSNLLLCIANNLQATS